MMATIMKDGKLDADGLLALCIHHENKIERLRVAMTEACDLLAGRTQGSAARSPGHNARLLLEAAWHAHTETATRILEEGR